MRLQYHAHSCFSLYTSSDTHILIDPYLNNNPLADVKAQDLSPDVVLVTHGHDDHLGDAVYFGQKGAPIISTAEIIHYLSLKDLTNLHPMQVGGGYQFPFGYVKMTSASHGSAVYEGEQIFGTGSPAGFLLEIDGFTLYHAGDTGLIMDMELLGRYYNIDLALLPIGGNFTMDPADALRAIDLIKPKAVIPMHYDTFPLIKQEPAFFAAECVKKGIACHVLRSGDALEI